MSPPSSRDTIEVRIRIREAVLEGFLTVPADCQAIVVFAHGSGSSRFSPRNTYIADILNEASLATLLFDLLTAEENEIDMQTRELRLQRLPLKIDPCDINDVDRWNRAIDDQWDHRDPGLSRMIRGEV